ncbi:2-hydroxyhepta-2,4-diene-1,7-dioate isomerase [Pseudonocardia sulfidoxydans NBRC 16205]|uniref:2-hydroxyhepta-2,4-diene-1,7-dioate isomerase n=1 Tax=Pseudonocardia sulfidoxydans NBRC 16205 TaxID=1223511 RepID=A0A511DFW9_9PSEU|nr:fumarylacetoacetate hydrolase family protein [Pseudonocardia sulfidoxydans]GEL23680.1 2-hydroxyhepta-2,4-diene-1,7-dioate isomerase [Pseudonocardia sulfidoxydans NBRC 16205]
MTAFRRLGPAGSERPVVEIDGIVFDLTPLTADIEGAFLAADGLARATQEARAGRLPVVDPTGLRIGPPVARPQAILCIGQNYAAHAAESGSPVPEQPILFLKHPNTLVGPDDDVVLPRGSTRGDWEVELAVVIGSRAADCGSDEEALAHVAGYAVANDVSEREYQFDLSGGQWSTGKTFPTFCPLGPGLVPADEVEPQALRLRSWVNGEPRQDSSTKDMVFDVATLVRVLSQRLVLEPGDLVLTGTPEGVALSGRFPYLVRGDVVEMEIDGLGRQRQQVR